jgi:hypothetical protein
MKVKKNQERALKGILPNQKSYLTLRKEQLEDIEDWEVGKEYTVELKVRMTGSRASADDDGNGEPEFSADFEVLKAESDDENGGKD